MPNGAPRISSRRRDTMMFGEVPISVIVPPSSEPNASGMSSSEGEQFERLAICSAIGIIIASAPMFFTNAESSVTAPTSTRICARGELMCGAIGCNASSMIPERATPALTISAPATMTTISSLKPLNAWSAGTTPISTATSNDTPATRS